MALILDTDFYRCPLCDGVTPASSCDECEGIHCQYCYDAYGCYGCE